MFDKNIRKILLVDGMKCENCAKRIKAILIGLDDVKKVDISVNKKEVIIVMKKDISNDLLKNKLENIGFKVIDFK